MATKFVTNLDLNQNQLQNARFQALASDPSSNLFEGWIYYNTTNDILRIYANGEWRNLINSVVSGGSHSTALTITESGGTVTITPNLATSASAGLMSASDFSKLADATSDATASKLVIRDASGNIKVADPTDPAHAATKGYVDAARSGLDVKQSVRAATTAPINLASDLENGDTLDTTVTLATGDRVLVKNQSTTSENGIYVVQASGAAVRATDFDTTAEVTAGAFTFVEEGTANGDTGWVVTTDGTITIGSTGITWAQFSGAGAIVAGDGLTKSGSTLNVGAGTGITVNADTVQISTSYTGQSSITTLGTISSGTWQGTAIGVAYGGTGATDAPTARTNLGLAIGTDVQAYDAELAAIAGLTSAADKAPYFTGSGTAALMTVTSAARTVLDDASTSDMRTTLGLAIGTDVQAYNSTLAAVAGGTYSGDDSITTVGTIASGTWQGTAVAVAYGGTGATTAANARNNLAETSASGLTTSTPTLARIASQSCAASVTGVSTTTVVHNFGTSDVIVQVYEVGTGMTVIADVDRDNTNQVTVVINGTVSLGDYKIVVTG